MDNQIERNANSLLSMSCMKKKNNDRKQCTVVFLTQTDSCNYHSNQKLNIVLKSHISQKSTRLCSSFEKCDFLCLVNCSGTIEKISISQYFRIVRTEAEAENY